MTYPPSQPFPGSDPNQPGGSPYAGPPAPPGGSPYAPPGGSPYAPPPANPYGTPPVNPYAAPGNPYAAPAGAAPFGAGGPPPDFKGWAIAAIFLCWPFAIPAFIASGKVSTLWAQGDIAGANQASADAKKWGSLGVYIGIGLNALSLICCCVYLFAMGGLAASGSASYGA